MRITRDNYVIMCDMRRTKNIRLTVFIRMIRSPSFANAKKRALSALRAEGIPHQGGGSVYYDITSSVKFNAFIYKEPMPLWERSMI